MDIINPVASPLVYQHWQRVDDRGLHTKIANQFHPSWFEARIEAVDFEHIYVIYAIDWQAQLMCTNNDYRLISTVNNYRMLPNNNPLKDQILVRRAAIERQDPRIDLKLFLLCSDLANGPYTILEGNKRAVALLDLNKLIGLNIYIGHSIGFTPESSGYIPPII